MHKYPTHEFCTRGPDGWWRIRSSRRLPATDAYNIAQRIANHRQESVALGRPDCPFIITVAIPTSMKLKREVI